MNPFFSFHSVTRKRRAQWKAPISARVIPTYWLNTMTQYYVSPHNTFSLLLQMLSSSRPKLSSGREGLYMWDLTEAVWKLWCSKTGMFYMLKHFNWYVPEVNEESGRRKCLNVRDYYYSQIHSKTHIKSISGFNRRLLTRETNNHTPTLLHSNIPPPPLCVVKFPALPFLSYCMMIIRKLMGKAALAHPCLADARHRGIGFLRLFNGG